MKYRFVDYLPDFHLLLTIEPYEVSRIRLIIRIVPWPGKFRDLTLENGLK